MFLFHMNAGFVSYAENNTPYCLTKGPEEVITKVEEPSITIFKWIGNNGIKANPGKCHTAMKTKFLI